MGQNGYRNRHNSCPVIKPIPEWLSMLKMEESINTV